MAAVYTRYTILDYVLLVAMICAAFVIAILLPPGILPKGEAGVVAFVSIGMNAYYWQDAQFAARNYQFWVLAFLIGAIIFLITRYTRSSAVVQATGLAMMYASPWSLVRMYLLKQFHITIKLRR